MENSIITSPAQQLTRPLDYTTQQIIREAVGATTSSSTGFQTGDFKFGCYLTEPVNWLLCDGRAISRTAYSTLYAVIGVNFGTGDGSTTFNLPPGGYVLAGYKSSGTFNNFLNTIGEETHTLITNEIPSHSHNLYVGQTGTGNPSVSALGLTTGGGNSGYIVNTGGGAAHNNIQPTVIAGLFIKYQ